VAVELTPENGRQLFVPKGFLHGFVTLADDTEVQYKCTDLYSPEHDGAVRWDDPVIGIDWGVAEPILSDKDARAPLLAEIGQPFRHGVRMKLLVTGGAGFIGSAVVRLAVRAGMRSSTSTQ
jgi:dTDP-4-dehydrorhamnose 3,5-epimerase